MSVMALPLAFWSPGPGEMLVIGVVALLLFGGDLPRVARSWGKTLSEFRRGLTGLQDEINDVIYSEPEASPPKLEYHPEFHDDSPKTYGAGTIDDGGADDDISAGEAPTMNVSEDDSTDESGYEFDRAVSERAAAERYGGEALAEPSVESSIEEDPSDAAST